MDPKVMIAIITASVAVTGWMVNHILTQRRERHNQQLAVYLRYIEKQLEELYGPLVFLLIEGRQAAMEVVETLGREPVFEGDNSLTEEETKLWLFMVEKDLLPRHEKMRDLLLKKTHLIEDGKVPLSFKEFLMYFNSWKIRHLLWREQNIAYNWRSAISWPTDFSENVINTFDALKKKHNDLRKKQENFFTRFYSRSLSIQQAEKTRSIGKVV